MEKYFFTPQKSPLYRGLFLCQVIKILSPRPLLKSFIGLGIRVGPHKFLNKKIKEIIHIFGINPNIVNGKFSERERSTTKYR